MRCSHRQSNTGSRVKAVFRSSALIATSCFLASAAHSASEVKVPCKDATEVTLRVTFDELVAEILGPEVMGAVEAHTVSLENALFEKPSSPLAPRAEAAIRDAFGNDETPLPIDVSIAADDAPIIKSKSNPVEPRSDDEDGAEADNGMHTRLPGISDVDFSRYKKRMFRRDI